MKIMCKCTHRERNAQQNHDGLDQVMHKGFLQFASRLLAGIGARFFWFGFLFLLPFGRSGFSAGDVSAIALAIRFGRGEVSACTAIGLQFGTAEKINATLSFPLYY